MENFAIDSEVHSKVEVLPMPVISVVILGQSLSLDKSSLRDATVLLWWFHDGNGVVFKVVIYPNISDPVELIGGLMHSLLEKGKKF